jgi:uncharacterized paraquat-inducible protein A
MQHRNRYCTRCQQTTRFTVEGARYTCTRCQVQVEVSAPKAAIEPVGSDPLNKYKVGSG